MSQAAQTPAAPPVPPPSSATSSAPSTLGSYMRGFLGSYLLGALMLLSFQFAMNRIDWLSKRAIDAIFASPQAQTSVAGVPAVSGSGGAGRAVAWMLVLAVFALVTRVASRWFIFNAGRDIEYQIRQRLLSSLQRLGMAFYRTISAGEIMSRATNDLTQIRLLTGFGILNVMNVVFALVSALQVMLAISPKLCGVSLLTLPLVMLLTRAFSGRTARGIENRFMRELRAVEQELPDYQAEQREPIVGGWCFSDGVHRWPVSDCTAEAVCALLALHSPGSPIPDSAKLSDERFRQAARFILRRQNEDGGFGSYEARRAGSLLENINPSEMYGSCMTERSYLECTSSCVRGLVALRSGLGARLGSELLLQVNTAIAKAVTLLRNSQRPDGSFPGFWGVNFTYGIFHVLEALHAAGLAAHDPVMQRAAVWLLSKQRDDGGWGEHYSSCLSGEYVPHEQSQVVNTSWAEIGRAHV